MKKITSKDAPKAAKIAVGVCERGACIDLIDGAGNVMAHAHGFDAAAVVRWLLKAAPPKGSA